MIKNKDEKDLKKALLNKAIGYTTQEIVEEYGYNGDEFVLQKRKTSTKSYPPDLTALKLLLDGEEVNEYEKMTDEELDIEKQKLLKLLKEKK